MSPEGVKSPRAHGVRQYLFGYITLREMPEKPNSVTTEEKEKADKLAQEYLGDIVVPSDATGDDVVLDSPKVDYTPSPSVTSDLESFTEALQSDVVQILSVGTPSQMLTTLLTLREKQAPQEVLDMLGEDREALLAIMNLMNEIEMIDLQRDSLNRMFEEKVAMARQKALALLKADLPVS